MRSFLLRSTIVVALIASAAWADTARPTPHNVFKCVINGNPRNTLYFAYDINGKMPVGQPDQPGYCKLNIDANGKPYGSYFCWVAYTQTADTTDGQLAIQFKDVLGGGVYNFTQINIPKNLPSHGEFTGTYRLIGRSAKNLSTPIAPRDASKIGCVETTLTFYDYR